MSKQNLVEKLKKSGWDLDIFQPSNEKYPWSIKITRELLSGEKVVITAYLDPMKKLTDAEVEKRIMSALKSEQIKNADLIEKCRYLDALSEITGKVKVQRIKKAVVSAKIKSENDEAMEKLADKMDDKAEQISIPEKEQKKRKRVIKPKVETSSEKATAVKKTNVKKSELPAKSAPLKAKKASELSKSAVSEAKSVKTKTVSSKRKTATKQAKTAVKTASKAKKKG